MNRRSYSGLMSQPAWGLYDGQRLLGTVRAEFGLDARDIFRRYAKNPAYGFRGENLVIRRIP